APPRTLTLSLHDALPISGVPREAGNLSMNLRYPQHFQTGISVKVHPRLTFNMDVGWTDYSVWDSMVLKFDRNLEFLTAARLLSPDRKSTRLNSSHVKISY